MVRLQLAIMAVPRQQNELYKQSLEAVASWIRSYFDTNAEVTQSFLKSVDELSEVSIYLCGCAKPITKLKYAG